MSDQQPKEQRNYNEPQTVRGDQLKHVIEAAGRDGYRVHRMDVRQSAYRLHFTREPSIDVESHD